MSAPPTERAGVLWGKRRSGEGTRCVRTSILARTIRFRACGDALGEVRGAPASRRRSRCWCEKPKVESCWSVKTHGRVRFHFLRMGIYTEMVCVFHRSWVLRSDSGRTKKSRNSLSILAETSLGRSHFEGPDLADGDDDGLATESQDRRSGCRRCREHGYIEGGVDQEGHEAEESLRPVRARGEEALELQGVQRVSARSSALQVQGVRWVCVLRARSSALSVQGVRWVTSMRARSPTLCMQGVRWVRNLRARSSAQ